MSKSILSGIATMLLLITTTGTVVAQDDPVIAKGKEAIEAKLKDPFSAQFKDVSHHTVSAKDNTKKEVVCGQVNAKNSYGGYAGFSYFIVIDGRPYIRDESIGGLDISGVFDVLWKNYCNQGS